MREVLRRRDIRYYLVGQTLSLFGSTSLWLAAGIWLKQLTGSFGAAGMGFFAITLGTLSGPLTAVLVDRLSRRSLLIATNLAGATLLVPLLLVRGSGQIWLIYAVLFGYGVLYATIASGQSALLTELLPTELLPHANGALRTVREGLRLVAPLAGAGLLAWQGFGAVVLLDIAGFLAAALSLTMIRVRTTPRAPERRERLREAVTAGLRYVVRSPVLRGFTLACAASTAVVGFTESAVLAVAEVGLGRPTEFVGVLMTVQGVGAIVGGPTAGWLVGRIGEIRLAALGLGCFAIGMALSTASSLPVVLAGVVLAGAGLPWIFVGAVTLLQRRTPGHLQGRVYAGFEVATTVPQTTSIAVGAALIGVVGYQALLLFAAVVMSGSALALLRLHRRTASTPPLGAEQGTEGPEVGESSSRPVTRVAV